MSVAAEIGLGVLAMLAFLAIAVAVAVISERRKQKRIERENIDAGWARRPRQKDGGKPMWGGSGDGGGTSDP